MVKQRKQVEIYYESAGEGLKDTYTIGIDTVEEIMIGNVVIWIEYREKGRERFYPWSTITFIDKRLVKV